MTSARTLWFRTGLAVAILGFLPCLAKESATIFGTVADASGAVLPSAKVIIKNLETGAVRNLESDTSGRFSAPSLPVGSFSITASKEGFKAVSKTGIHLVLGQAAEENLVLS